ncbi:PTS lactose/cellobiose transporter subunit IIA [Priestia megaterium]|uniref:PTS lactose/cellobiose transporter subunit IIA n=1 Tax=Priestia megaterium TaxID=1404 RepID=A0A6H1NYU8_PRIMG|nr:PTS lactose/cellobiose transporter subunit IIA [Priestia megaterium]QIZ06453.1 PTS lactose/cellobiose transporter subunit IIA [Priestia megaterium]
MIDEIMAIITHAGDAKSDAYEALELAKEGDFDTAAKLMKQAKATMIEAHKAQTQLLQREAQGEDLKISILLIHAQDHLMTSKLAQELIEQLIEQTKEIQELKKNFK